MLETEFERLPASPNTLRGICRIRINGQDHYGVSQEERARRIRRHQRELERLWAVRLQAVFLLRTLRENLSAIRWQARVAKTHDMTQALHSVHDIEQACRDEERSDALGMAIEQITTIRAIDTRAEFLRAELRRLGA